MSLGDATYICVAVLSLVLFAWLPAMRWHAMERRERILHVIFMVCWTGFLVVQVVSGWGELRWR